MAHDQQDFGAALKLARQRHGLNQGDVARAAGASESSVRNWERGTTRPYPRNLRAIAELLELDLEALLAGDVVSSGDDETSLEDRVAALERQIREVIRALPGQVPPSLEEILHAGALAPQRRSSPTRRASRG